MGTTLSQEVRGGVEIWQHGHQVVIALLEPKQRLSELITLPKMSH
jgi:hypothetical protein